MINGNVRFEIRKYRGTNRINIDDIIIDDNIVPIGGIFPETLNQEAKPLILLLY
jgi:hypothetical protein